MLEQIITSLVRTVTPWVIGVAVTLLARAGLDWKPSAEAFLLVSQLVSAGFYALARILELRYGRLWGVLLGVPKAPTYDATAKADQGSPTGESAAPASPLPEGTPVETEPAGTIDAGTISAADVRAGSLSADYVAGGYVDDNGTNDGGLTDGEPYVDAELWDRSVAAPLVAPFAGAGEQHPRGRLALVIALAVVALLEAIGIITDRDTISGLTADVFQVDTAGGRYAFAVAWIAFAGWFLFHILTWVRSVKARGSATAARMRR